MKLNLLLCASNALVMGAAWAELSSEPLTDMPGAIIIRTKHDIDGREIEAQAILVGENAPWVRDEKTAAHLNRMTREAPRLSLSDGQYRLLKAPVTESEKESTSKQADVQSKGDNKPSETKASSSKEAPAPASSESESDKRSDEQPRSRKHTGAGSHETSSSERPSSEAASSSEATRESGRCACEESPGKSSESATASSSEKSAPQGTSHCSSKKRVEADEPTREETGRSSTHHGRHQPEEFNAQILSVNADPLPTSNEWSFERGLSPAQPGRGIWGQGLRGRYGYYLQQPRSTWGRYGWFEGQNRRPYMSSGFSFQRGPFTYYYYYPQN